MCENCRKKDKECCKEHPQVDKAVVKIWDKEFETTNQILSMQYIMQEIIAVMSIIIAVAQMFNTANIYYKLTLLVCIVMGMGIVVMQYKKLVDNRR